MYGELEPCIFCVHADRRSRSILQIQIFPFYTYSSRVTMILTLRFRRETWERLLVADEPFQLFYEFGWLPEKAETTGTEKPIVRVSNSRSRCFQVLHKEIKLTPSKSWMFRPHNERTDGFNFHCQRFQKSDFGDLSNFVFRRSTQWLATLPLIPQSENRYLFKTNYCCS